MLEAAVVGVPDELTGEAVVAYVRPDPDRVDAADAAAVAELRRARRARPARCGWRGSSSPRGSRSSTALPRTVTGKVAKGRLRTVLRREGMGLLE